MGRKEAYVEDYLVKTASEKGFLCRKLTTPGTNGSPDRMLIGHGLVLFVETKKEKGQLRPIQKENIKEMRSHGANVYVCDTREAVDEMFEQIKQSDE